MSTELQLWDVQVTSRSKASPKSLWLEVKSLLRSNKSQVKSDKNLIVGSLKRVLGDLLSAWSF